MNERKPAGFSRPIDLRWFERESRRLLRWGILFALFVEAGLVLLMPPREHLSVVIPPSEPQPVMHMDIIEIPRQPPSPFLAGESHFRPRLLRPGGIVRPGARLPGMPGIPGRAIPSPLADRAYTLPDQPLSTPELKAGTDSTYALPEEFTASDRVGRLIPGEMTMEDELLTPDDFSDTKEARTRGMVFYNPQDRLSIRGILPIPILMSAGSPPQCLSPGLLGLDEAIQMYSDITPGFRKSRYILDNSRLEYPFLYIACDQQWEYLPQEAKAIGEYLRRGGFVYFENLRAWDKLSPAEASLRQFIRDALGSGSRLSPIPKDHPLYHCYFDFPDGPPLGTEGDDPTGRVVNQYVGFLEGVWINGRLAAIYSNKGYGNIWARQKGGDAPFKMGVNILIYALKQEGGTAVKKTVPALKPGIHALRNIAGQTLKRGPGPR